MITICSIREVRPEEHDETWAIVRSYKNVSTKVRQVADLSPSWNLFSKYRGFVSENRWGIDAFEGIYLPQFISEMQSGRAGDLINELRRADREGRDICLFCYCADESLCHRSIIAGILQGYGCDVRGVSSDYSRYFDMYTNKREYGEDMGSNEMRTEPARYTNSETEQRELNNQFVRYINPLVFNDSIFLANEYIHDHDGMPLTVSQCKYIRQYLMNDLYGDVFRELVYNMSEDLDTDMDGMVNLFMGEMMDRMFDRDGREGILETYLKENRLLPEKAESSLAEYADKKNFTVTDMNKKLDSMKQQKNLRALDVFGVYRYKGQEVQVADLDVTQAYLEKNAYKQKALLNLSEEDREQYEPVSLSRQYFFAGTYPIGDEANGKKLDYNIALYENKDDRIIPMNRIFYPNIKTLSKTDKTGLYRLRRYIGADSYNQLARQISNKITDEDPVMNDQAIRNAVTICQDLERRGLPFTIGKDSKAGQLKAAVSLGKKDSIDIRIFDYENPNYVGRTFNGTASYFRFASKSSGTVGAKSDIYFPNEEDVLVLLAHSLGEHPQTPELKPDGTHFMVGENGDVRQYDGNTSIPVLTRNNERYNMSYWSAENSNTFYRLARNNDGYIQPVYIYNEGYSRAGTENPKFETPDDAMKYINESIEMAKQNYQNVTLGTGFLERSEVTESDFPDSYVPDIRKLQLKYREYLDYDDTLLQEAGESDETFSQRLEEFRQDETAELPDYGEKRADIVGHSNETVRLLFGHTDGTGSEDNPITLNVAAVAEYSGEREADLITAMKACGSGTKFDLMQTDEFNMNRIRELLAAYDDDSGRSILENDTLSPFMSHVRNTVLDSLEAQGVEVSGLDLDQNGIIRYEGTVVNKMLHDGDTDPETRQITGYIGQIFEPDERGVIVTRYNHDDNRAIIPKYTATVERPDPEENLSLEKRTICCGYEEMLDRKIRLNIHRDFAGRTYDSDVNTTQLNGIYRELYAAKIPADYMAYYRAKGMDDEYINALIKTQKSVVRYPTSFIDNSTLNTWYDLKKRNFINDINKDDSSVTLENVAILNDCEAFDYLATGNARNQGILRYMREHASVNPETGHLEPPYNPDGTINENDKMALLNLPMFRYIDYNPADRVVMVVGNSIDCLQVDRQTAIAHITLEGWCMDDAYVISRDYAERHLVNSGDAGTTEKLDPGVIQSHICDPDGFLMTSCGEDGQEFVHFYGHNYPLDKVNSRFGRPENEQTREEVCAGYIKEELIKNDVGLRPLMAGDKICDLGGNKGVISLVVDRTMSSDTAKRLNLEYEVELFKINRELEVVGAPFTAPSRMNAGTVREMMENARELKLPDGTVIEGGMGTASMIITDKLVDEKTHIYDETHGGGKGRNASSQFAWQLQAKHADTFMQLIYGQNDKNFGKVRERLIALGYDIDENNCPVKGYSPHSITFSGDSEEKVIHETRNIIETGEPEIYPSKDGLQNRTDLKEAVKKLQGELSQKGGFLRLPFEIELESGAKTEPACDGKGGYLLPVLPPMMRADETYDDGSKITHDYTRRYLGIVRHALDYKAKEAQIKEYARLINNEPDEDGNYGVSKKVAVERKYKGQILKGAQVYRYKIRKPVSEKDDIQKKAQAAYNELAKNLHDTYFVGKKNVCKTELMCRMVQNSATAVWFPDPRLKIDECRMDDEMMKKLHLKEGDKALLWRDPLLRPEGVAVLTVRRCNPEDQPIVGIAVNPVIDKRFDGDFDGDSVAVCSLSDAVFIKDVENADRRINRLLKRIEKIQEGGLEDQEGLERLEMQLSKAKGDYDRAGERLAFFNSARDEIIDKFSVVNTLTDLAETPDNPKTPEEVVFALNFGLDIASAKGRIQESGQKVMVPDSEGNMTDVLDLPELAKQDIIDGNNAAALANLNIYVQTLFGYADASDYNDYSRWENYYESQNRMIVDHKAKGKMKSMVECAKYANTGVTFVCDGDDHVYTAEEMSERMDSDKKAIFRINTAEGEITDYGAPVIHVEINNPNLSKKQRNEIIRRKDEMKDMIRQVQLATAIKTIGTGTAGAFSQKGIKITRDNEPLNTLEITYGATQGILQAKHDAVQAERLYTILRDTLPSLLKGKPIMNDPDKGWIPDTGNGDKSLSKSEFIQQYYDLCNSPDGLNYNVCRQRIENLASVLYTVDESGKEKFISFYDDEFASNLDRCAYPKGNDSLKVIKQIAELNMELPKDKRNSMFNSRAAKQFVPDKDSAKFELGVMQCTSDVSSDTERSIEKESSSEKHAAKDNKNVQQKDNDHRAGRNLDNRILVIGPTPEKLYGNDKDRNTIDKYKMLTQELKSYAQKLYEDGYREFVTISAPGYNKLLFEAVNSLKAEHPGEIKNFVLCPGKDCYKDYTENENHLFVSKGVKKMIDESDRFIDVSQKLKGGMDEAVAISRHISVMYPEGGSSWHKRRDDVLSRYMQIALKYGNDLKQHEFFPQETNAYKEYHDLVGRHARLNNMVAADAYEANAKNNDKNMQYD
ncbi:hypothetical protein C804_03565 [Lachnospiraceae bacterium A4]|nr:hypothetical protein C804_03565 [Lachnospiraceae bacterium A4]